MTSKEKKIVIISVSILLIIFGILIIYAVSRKPTLSIEGERTEYGKEGYFTVRAKNFEKDTAAFDITLSFDNDQMEILEVSKGSLDSEVVSSREMLANEKGEMTLLFLDYTGGDEPIDIDGDLCYVRYKVIKPMVSSVDFSKVNIVNPDGVIKKGVRTRGALIGQ